MPHEIGFIIRVINSCVNLDQLTKALYWSVKIHKQKNGSIDEYKTIRHNLIKKVREL